MNVLSFGEILWDVIEGEEHLGGAPFNFAAHSAQCGNNAYIISRLGTDHLGMRAFNQCKTCGVDNRFVQWDEVHPTGTVDVTLSKGQPDYVIHENVAYDFIAAEQVMREVLKINVDVFYFGSLIQRNPVSAKTLETLLKNIKSKHVFYDVNLRKGCYNDAIIRNSLKVCNVFKLNNEELPVISKILVGVSIPMEEFLRSLVSLFPNIKTVIITAAEKGCYLFEQGKGLSHVPGVPVTVADAVGAGDSFSAAFMHMLGNFGDPLHAARVANRIGAFVASKHGPIPEYTSEIRQLLKKQPDALGQLRG